MQYKIVNNVEIIKKTFPSGTTRIIHKMNGKRHNPHGPALIWSSGYQEWCFEGHFHRIGGPAISWPNGDYEYWVNGLLHNLNGPARKFGKFEEFFIEGKQYSKEEFLELTAPKDKKQIAKLNKVLRELKKEAKVAQNIKEQYEAEIGWVLGQLDKLTNVPAATNVRNFLNK